MTNPGWAASRADDDAAVVLTVLAALVLSAEPEPDPTPAGVWDDPAHRLGVATGPSSLGWWASGMPR